MKQREATRPFYRIRSFVKVRWINVPVTEMGIYQFYDAPYYYHDYLYKIDLKEFKKIDTEQILGVLMEGKEMWTYRTGTTIPETFNQELMTPRAKMLPIEQAYKTMNRPRKLLGDDVFKQFILLQTKRKEERRKRGFQEDDE
ncbi:hypothetical protein Gotri_025083 [Gossypium trilobum]|uniref:Uncharacterized protein n=1 Tax=Gossypium trilobum TaxID=34281 RepID=A0A7J9FV04_9ROSI|nr:hypothetical protein [Gossypium trilobum]